MGLGDIFSYLEEAYNGIYSDIKVVIAQATTGDRKSDDLGAIKNEYKNSIKKLAEDCKKVEGNLEKAEKDSVKAAKAEKILGEYKDLKKCADLSNAVNVFGMRSLLKEAHKLSETELIEWKATMNAAVTALSSVTNIQKIININIGSYLDVGSAAIDKILKSIDSFQFELNAMLGTTPSILNNNLKDIAKTIPEIDVNAVIATKEMREIILKFEELKKNAEKLFNITASGVAAKTNSSGEPNYCCLYSKTLCCLLASIAGIKTPESLKAGNDEETSGKEKNYVKTFGHGYISKGLYEAIKNACSQARGKAK